MPTLTTDSLVKSSWNFLNQNDIRLRHDISFAPQRVIDHSIMEYWIDEDISIDILHSLNQCRLFLQAFFISNIMDGFGTHVSDATWNGKRTRILDLHKDLQQDTIGKCGENIYKST